MAERREAEAPRARGRRSRPATWLMHHRLALQGTLRQLARDAFGTGLLALTLGVALALPLLLYLAIANLQTLGERWDGAPRLNVFLEAVPAEPERVLERLGADPAVAEIDYISPEAALEEFGASMGLRDAAALLERNPLPPVALVTPRAEDLVPARLEALVRRLETAAGVASVQVDLGWVRRLRAALDVVEMLVLGLAILLALAVVLVIGSQTRTAVEQGLEEIRVMKLVGGTDGFVQRPFLYRGALYGLAGGVMACLVVGLVALGLSGPLQDLARSYGSSFAPAALSPGLVVATVLGAALLGWLGALLATRRRLQEIEP